MKPGIYDMPFDEYLSDPCPEPSLNRGTINLLTSRTPAHAWVKHPRLGARDQKPSRRAEIGSTYHEMLLRSGHGLHVIQALDTRGEQASDYKTKAAREERDAAIASGLTPVLQKDMDALEPMVNEARTFYSYTKIPLDLVERTIVWEEDGVWFRARPDIIDMAGRKLYDPKSATDADPFTWVRRTVYPGGYDIQAALYKRGIEAITGEPWDFFWIPQELSEPYGCARILAGESLIRLANLKIDRAVQIWRECLENDEWPRYGYEDHVAHAPVYQEHEWEAREKMSGNVEEWESLFEKGDE